MKVILQSFDYEVPDEGYSRLSNLLTEVPDEGYSRLSNLLRYVMRYLMKVFNSSRLSNLLTEVPDEGYSRLSNLLTMRYLMKVILVFPIF